MQVGPRRIGQLVAVVSVALAVAGCGGGANEATQTTTATTSNGSDAAQVVEGSELAGVRVDVRRDPG